MADRPAMEQDATGTPDAPAPFLEESDLVKILSLGVLATVEHIGGETSSDESDDEHEHEEMLHFHNLFHNNHGHNHHVPGHEHTPAVPGLSAHRRPLISRYADDFSDDGEDDGPNEGDRNADIEPEDGPDDAIPDDADHEHGDHEDEGPEVPIGSALVTRIDNGEDVVVPVTELEVLDRALAPGQLVLSAVPGDTNLQSGAVREIKKTVVVRRMSDWDPNDANAESSTFELPAERLSFFSEVRVDGYVVCRDWLGVVEFIQEDVFVEFPCGSIAVVAGHPGWLQPDDARVSPRRNPDAEGFFFPGMRVKAAPRVWREASWLRGRYRRQRTGVVRSAKMTNVGVQWMAVRQNLEPSQYDPPPQQPPDVVPYSEVRALDAFRSLWWRAGDRALLVPEQVADEEQWVEALPAVPAPVVRDERAAARPSRPVRRHTSRGNGRLIAAQRRARELSSQEDPNAGSASVTSDPSAVLQIISTRTVISVLWQNGVLEENIPSVNLRANEHPGAFDFWPGLIVARASDDAEPANGQTATSAENQDRLQYVGGSLPARDLQRPGAVEIDQFASQPVPSSAATGIVVRSLLSERTAVVRWQKPNSREYFEEEEELSFYDLTALADYDMQLGDTVLLLSRDPSLQNGANGEPRWVGEIVGKGIGDIRVRWLGGDETTVTPDQIIVVSDSDDESEDDDEESEYDGVGEEEGMETAHAMNDPAFRANWEITDYAPSELSAAVNDELEDVFRNSEAYRLGLPLRFSSDSRSIGDIVDDMTAAVTTDFAPVQQRQILTVHHATQLAHEIGGRLLAASVAQDPGSADVPGENGPRPSWVNAKEKIREVIERIVADSHKTANTRNESVESAIKSDAPSENMDMQKQNGIAVDSSNVKDKVASSDKAGPSAVEELDIARFEVVEKFENHFFESRSSSATGQSHRPGFSSIVLKEYSRLGRNLPSGIYVHGSESQQDLLRAAIVGPPDTPYENVLFYFDIFLPLMYPSEPPKVHFWSHGRRLNPNLYEDGKVCLSILGTWSGDDVEQWDARNSNVLRVLLSLQAMVFVEQPYYNEAGYEKQVGTVEGRNNSRTYNESTLLLCIRHLLQSIRPGGSPKDFDELKRSHHSGKAKAIIARLQTLSYDSETSEDNEKANCPEGVQYTSRGFKRSLKELIPRVDQSLKSLSSS